MGNSYIRGHSYLHGAFQDAHGTLMSSIHDAVMADESAAFPDQIADYDWQHIGEKVSLIPFNCVAKIPQSRGTPKIPAPESIRWELRHVSIVEGALNPGESNQLQRFCIYVDTAKHLTISGESFDRHGALIKWYMRYFDARRVMIGPGQWYAN